MEIESRVRRIERELWMWRIGGIAVVAAGAVLACRSGGGAAKPPESAQFKQLTVGDGETSVFIGPGIIRIKGGDANDATLDAHEIRFGGDDGAHATVAATGLEVAHKDQETLIAAGLGTLRSRSTSIELGASQDRATVALSGVEGAEATLAASKTPRLYLSQLPAKQGAPIAELNLSLMGDPIILFTDRDDHTAELTQAGGFVRCPKDGC